MANIDTRESVTVALSPVLCIDCNNYVPAGWVDFTDAPKCVTGKSHRVPTHILVNVIDVARNAENGK